MAQTRVMVTQQESLNLPADLLVYCLFQRKKTFPRSVDEIRSVVKRAYALRDFEGKTDQSFLVYRDSVSKSIQAKRILLVGLGETDSQKDPDVWAEMLRVAGGKIAAACKKHNVSNLGLELPDLSSLSTEKTAQFICEGVLLGDYRFDKYKKNTKKKSDYKGLKNIRIAGTIQTQAARSGVKKALIGTEAVCKARDMANEPGNGWTSREFARYAKLLSKEYGLKYRCLTKKDLEKLGMGGILAVNQGSAVPPRMIILEYNPKKSSETLLLVGKGITFDSGGISIKPALGMQEMKYDMCGGAAVLCAMQAVAQEKPNIRVVAIVPATDNMSGSHAVRPGDIIRHYNGVTSEIVNTDAEGRMILGDALSYGVKTYKPDGVIDVATLTGAVIIGLGHHFSGLVGSHDGLCQKLIEAGNQAGEPIWRLPLNDDYKKQIESEVADIKNVGGRPAGTITAAAYLSNFVGDTPWAHLDIAGTAWDFTEKSYIPKGPSGICVRTFLYLVRNWKKGTLKKG